jgi:hypothetical protein
MSYYKRHLQIELPKRQSAFCEEHHPKSAYLICLVPRARRINRDGLTIDILPVKTFLEQLWQGKII